MRRVAAGLMFLLASVAAVAGPTIVVGVTPVDGTTTHLLRLDAETASDVVVSFDGADVGAAASVEHRRGYAPLGTVVDDRHVALVVAVGNADDGLLVLRDLATGVDVPLLDRVLPSQAPLLHHSDDGRRELVVVRDLGQTVAGGTFDVAAIDLDGGAFSSTILASTRALWVAPVLGDVRGALQMLVVDGPDGIGGTDGHAHVDVVSDGALTKRWSLGTGIFHSPVRFGGHTLIEKAVVVDKASVLVADDDRILVQGLPGLQPVVAVAGARAVMASSTGRKNGSVLVWRNDNTASTLLSGRAGVARPLAVTVDGNDVVVVAWLDRGASLPGELWAISASGSRRLLAPMPRTAVTVYGLVSAGASAPKPKTTTTPATTTPDVDTSGVRP